MTRHFTVALPDGIAPADVVRLCDEIAESLERDRGIKADVVQTPVALILEPEEAVALVCALDIVIGEDGSFSRLPGGQMLRAIRQRARELIR